MSFLTREGGGFGGNEVGIGGCGMSLRLGD